MNDLRHGSALVVEDLQVTMNVVTFIVPRNVTRTYLDRIVKNLKQRRIEFYLSEFNVSAWWNKDLMLRRATIGFPEQEVQFEVDP